MKHYEVMRKKVIYCPCDATLSEYLCYELRLNNSISQQHNNLTTMLYWYLQGTEVKAITYSAMQIYDKEKSEIFAIVDI